MSPVLISLLYALKINSNIILLSCHVSKMFPPIRIFRLPREFRIYAVALYFQPNSIIMSVLYCLIMLLNFYHRDVDDFGTKRIIRVPAVVSTHGSISAATHNDLCYVLVLSSRTFKQLHGFMTFVHKFGMQIQLFPCSVLEAPRATRQ
jgi:hypothetical protein